jgi:hypothetical protein
MTDQSASDKPIAHGDDPAAPPVEPTTEPPFDPPAEPLVFASRPPTAGERVLAEKFHERLAGQSAQMDELARQMISVELAVPGLYASILALLRGQEATLPAGWPLLVTFGCWFAALALTFVALFPRNYRVDPTILRADPAAESEDMGFEDFFRRSAQYKRRLLLAAALLFWAGIVAAVWVLFGS